MPEFSNLLRQRLGAAQEKLRDHPDPDVLTAFTERLLSAPERQQVLAHLASCDECREVLALSHPEALAPATQPVLTPAAAPFWRRLLTPAFGMAASLAAVAVIAIVVLQSPQKTPLSGQSSNQQEAKVASPAQPKPADQKTMESASAAQPAIPAPGAVPSGVPSLVAPGTADLAGNRSEARPASGVIAELAPNKKSLLPARDAANRQSAGPQPTLTAGLRKQDYLNNAFFETGNADVVASPNAPQPKSTLTEASAFTANAPGQITIFSDIPANAAGAKSNVRVFTPAPPPEHFGFNLGKLAMKGARTVLRAPTATPAMPAISSNALVSSAMGTSRFGSELQKSQPAEVAAAPEKAESASGLERTDALSRRSMASGSTYAFETAAPVWKIVGGKLLRSTGTQWEDAYPVSSFQFTAVSAFGNEVWAGGSHAELIHSRNGGSSWETSHLGEAASGYIVSIVLLGTSVQVKTSDDQKWSSSDGGKTWTKQ